MLRPRTRAALGGALAAASAASTAACRRPPPAAAERAREAQEAARRALADERAHKVATLPARTVGVTPLRAAVRDTAVAPLAHALADLLLADLAQSRSLVVVDRLRVDAMLRELRFAASGAVDPATAPRVGRLLGARRLVAGALAGGRDGRLYLDVRVADAATGRVGRVVTGTAPLADVLAAEKELAFRLFDALGVTLTPAERAAVSQRPTRDLGALLAYGRAVRYEVAGRYADAAREYAGALRRDPAFARARARFAEAQRAASPPPAAALDVAERLNRPLTAQLRAPRGGAGDPAFPQPSTIIVTVRTQP
jgi:TolB-like protein